MRAIIGAKFGKDEAGIIILKGRVFKLFFLYSLDRPAIGLAIYS